EHRGGRCRNCAYHAKFDDHRRSLPQALLGVHSLLSYCTGSDCPMGSALFEKLSAHPATCRTIMAISVEKLSSWTRKNVKRTVTTACVCTRPMWTEDCITRATNTAI